MGVGCKRIAKMLKMGTSTEREYRRILKEEGLLEGDVRDLPDIEVLKEVVMKHKSQVSSNVRESTAKIWEEKIRGMLMEGATPTAIYDRLRLEEGEEFKCSLSSIKRFCRKLRKEEGIKEGDVAIPVETEPGEVAQVDFGYAGKFWDGESGKVRKGWAFTMVLGYSRHMYANIVFDQGIETWLKLHREAFEFFGGVPRTVVPDNLKSAVIRAAFGVDDEAGLNRSYLEFARYYGFLVDPTPPRSPRKKGKVERVIRYIKHNFLVCREMEEIKKTRGDLLIWLKEIAGMRIHGTTGKKPLELFEKEEKGALIPLPQQPFETVIWAKAKVHPDSHICFDKRLYSVPWKFIGQWVWVRATSSTVEIYFDEGRIATHSRRGSGWRSTVDSHLPEYRSQYRYRSRSYWEEEADKLGEQVGQYIREVFDSGEVLSKLRTVQGMVTYLKKLPQDRANAACYRASYYGSYTLRGIKNIIKAGLDKETIADDDEDFRLNNQNKSPQYRFCRSINEILFNLDMEVNNASNR